MERPHLSWSVCRMCRQTWPFGLLSQEEVPHYGLLCPAVWQTGVGYSRSWWGPLARTRLHPQGPSLGAPKCRRKCPGLWRVDSSAELHSRWWSRITVLLQDVCYIEGPLCNPLEAASMSDTDHKKLGSYVKSGQFWCCILKLLGYAAAPKQKSSESSINVTSRR